MLRYRRATLVLLVLVVLISGVPIGPTVADIPSTVQSARRVIFYKPERDNNDTKTVNKSNIFDPPKLCQPGYQLDRHSRCRRVMVPSLNNCRMRLPGQLLPLLLVLLLLVMTPHTTAVRIIFRRPVTTHASGAPDVNNANILRSPNLVGSSCGNGQVTDIRGICRNTVSF
uniref:Uncharacterized protein n=1 Tax=Anopheles epiroticus TaxID=199890 RepID=A0A182PVM4_9DIPT